MRFKIKKVGKEEIFLLAYIIYLVQAFLTTTMFVGDMIPYVVVKIIRYIAILLAFVKILMDKYDKRKVLILFIIFILFCCSSYFSTYRVLIEYFIFMLAANKVNIKKIIKIFFVTSSIMLIITIISAKLGLIENLIYYRGVSGKKRESFGVIYPTDFAAHVFFICLSYLVLRRKNIKGYEYLCITIVAFAIYYFCDARLDTISILIAVLITFLYNKKIISCKSRIVQFLLSLSFVFFAILSISLSINYNENKYIHNEINHILSGRLELGNKMINRHGIKLFGQKIDDHGFGGSTEFNYEEYEYNYIDCSYVRILLKYGVAILIIIGISNAWSSKRIIREKNYFLLLIMFVISINSIVAQHYIDFSYNFLLLVYFADVSIEEENLENEKKYNKKLYI